MHLAQRLWSEDNCSQNMASFTALNGAEAKSPDAPSGSSAARRAASEERPDKQLPVPESKGGEGPTSQREHWTSRGPEGASHQPANYPDAEMTSHKRKRSGSPEPTREPQSRLEQPAESRDTYSTPRRGRDYRSYGEERREPHDMWYAQQGREDRGAYDQQASAGTVPPQTDEQAGDTHRRGTSQVDSQHEYPATSPDGDDNPSIYGGSHTPDGRRDAVVSDPKKRKRNFSNRTKTGCLTCRKRKKKCDEAKPECKLAEVSRRMPVGY